MKKGLLVCALLYSVLSLAQLTLEKSYEQNTLKRIKLEISGEKYYVHNKADNTVVLFNDDYTLWKTISLQLPVNALYVNVNSVSQTVINPDNNIEVSYGFYSAPNPVTSESRAVSEDGSVLLEIPGAYLSRLDIKTGFPSKLIATTINNSVSPALYLSKVYSLPSLALEKEYTNGEVKRVFLENSGEKYYLLDKPSEMLRLYNTDHTSWKNIALPKPPGFDYSDSNIILSEIAIKPDSQVEVGYGLNDNNQIYKAKVVNESGNVLLEAENAISLEISHLDGLPDKLLVSRPFWPATTSVYSLPSLALDHSYDSKVSRVKLEDSGEKYFTSGLFMLQQISVFNADHSVWKTIPFADSLLFQPMTVGHISEKFLNNDTLLEVVYCGTSILAMGLGEDTAVVNEDGTLFQQITGVGISLSEIDGLAPKFMGNAIDAPFSAVYGIDFLTTPEFRRTVITMHPNPAKDFLNFQSENAIQTAHIYDSRGVLVKTVAELAIKKVAINDLSAGIYFVQLSSGNSKSVHKIVVSK